jgi:hypothetical protein
MKRKITTALALLSICLLATCGSSSNKSGTVTAGTGDQTTDPGNIDTAPYAVSVGDTAATYNADDVVANKTFDYTIAIDCTAETAQLSTGSAQAITTDGTAVITADTTSVTISKTADGITIASTLDAAVKYILSGNLDGTLTLTSEKAYGLYLNGLIVTASAGPALDLESSKRVFIVTGSGTTNTLSDASTHASITKKGAIYGKGQMIFSGEGTLNITGNFKHGVYCSDYIRICGGTINATANTGNVLQSVNGFIFDDGTLTVAGTNTTIDEESKGIKVEGSEDNPGEGFIVINGGRITVNTVGKAITAAWDIDDDASTAVTTDDPTPYLTINNGIITIATSGSVYENADGTSCSPEGIESKTNLTINSGYITISTADDCINAGTSITINGGYIRAASSDNDAIDSNGTMTITGGVIVASGSEVPEEAFDCDSNTFTITGGTFVGIAGATSTPTASVCTQNAIKLGSGTKGSTFALIAADGTVVTAFTIPQSYSTMLLTSPLITKNTSYTVYTGGTADGDTLFNGLYLSNLSYSGGTAGTSFTVSSSYTNAGGSDTGPGGN